MANCIRCGRQLSGFTLGKKICPWCKQHEAQQRGEIVEDSKQPVMRTPWVRRGESSISLTQIFFGINVAVYLGMVLASGSPFQEFSGAELVQWGANAGALTLAGEWWRLLTCVFVHGGLLHIAFNMWCLWDLGALSESLYGRWTFGALYIICGLGASLASVIWNPHVLSVGASGAIFGLAGALIAAFKLGEFSVPRAALSGTLRSLLVFVGFNLIFGVASGVTDNAAHVGGLVTGLILGALIAKFAPLQDHAPRRLVIFLATIFGLAGGASALAHHYGLPLRVGRASFFDNGKPENAIAQLEKMVKQRPDFVAGHFNLAQAYVNQGEYDRAEGELKRVLQLQPNNTRALASLGMVYLNQNHLQEAKDTFSQLLARDSSNAEAHYGMGLALAGEGDQQAAIEEFKSAAHLDPQAAGVHYDLGASYTKLKQYDDAIASYLKEREIRGDDYELENALAEAYQAKGSTQDAESARNKATQLKAAER